MQVVTTIKKLNYNNLNNITRLYKVASSFASNNVASNRIAFNEIQYEILVWHFHF